MKDTYLRECNLISDEKSQNNQGLMARDMEYVSRFALQYLLDV